MGTKQKNDRLWPDILLILMQATLLLTAIFSQAFYLIGCGGLLLWFGGFRLLAKKRNDSWLSILLIFPAVVLCALSVAPLFWGMMPVYSAIQTGIVCALVGAQAMIVAASLIARRKEKDTPAWVMRQFDFALLCVLLSALVSQLLLLGEESEWAQMVCLTGCAMSGILLLLGCNLLLCALCGYRGTRDSIQLIRDEFQRRRRLFHFVSVGKDGFMVLAKLVMSIVSTSFFMFANALFSCGIGLARYTALRMHGKEASEQLRLYRWVSVILSFSGLCYVGYSVRLFFGGTSGRYGMVMALAIAAYTFVEFGIQIYDLIKLRKQKDLEAKALRLISLCGILVSFVLTQTAIMSFSEQTEHNFSDGLAGVVFGGIVVLVGIIMQFCSYVYLPLQTSEAKPQGSAFYRS